MAKRTRFYCALILENSHYQWIVNRDQTAVLNTIHPRKPIAFINQLFVDESSALKFLYGDGLKRYKSIIGNAKPYDLIGEMANQIVLQKDTGNGPLVSTLLSGVQDCSCETFVRRIHPFARYVACGDQHNVYIYYNPTIDVVFRAVGKTIGDAWEQAARYCLGLPYCDGGDEKAVVKCMELALQHRSDLKKLVNRNRDSE